MNLKSITTPFRIAALCTVAGIGIALASGQKHSEEVKGDDRNITALPVLGMAGGASLALSGGLGMAMLCRRRRS